MEDGGHTEQYSFHLATRESYNLTGNIIYRVILIKSQLSKSCKKKRTTCQSDPKFHLNTHEERGKHMV